jgi:hypothetical protein
MIASLLFFIIAMVYGDKRSLQSADSNFSIKELEEKIISDLRRNELSLSPVPITRFSPKIFLKNIGLMDDCPFVLLWHSYGNRIWHQSRATGRKFLREISKDGRYIFKEMKDNYEKYLIGTLLKEFLSSNSDVSKEDKVEVLFKAMELYYGKFHSIWVKIVEPRSETFDDLKATFSFLYQAIHTSIFDLIESGFEKIMGVLEDPSKKDLLYTYKKQYCELVDILAINDNENWGLRWISNQKNSLLIFTFFYYHRCAPDRNSTFLQNIMKTRKIDFKIVLDQILKMMNHNFVLKGNELKFEPDFKSPFSPQIMGVDELKSVLSKIISKLLKFCFS